MRLFIGTPAARLHPTVGRGCSGGATSPPSAASDLTIGFDRFVLAKLPAWPHRRTCATATSTAEEYSRKSRPGERKPPRGGSGVPEPPLGSVLSRWRAGGRLRSPCLPCRHRRRPASPGPPSPACPR